MAQFAKNEPVYVALFGIPTAGATEAPSFRTVRPGTNIADERVRVTTLRTTLPDAEGVTRQYLRTSEESCNFVFARAIDDETPAVVGLDVDAKGVVITPNGRQLLLMASALDLQARQQAARADAEIPDEQLPF